VRQEEEQRQAHYPGGPHHEQEKTYSRAPADRAYCELRDAKAYQEAIGKLVSREGERNQKDEA
jgi:hypothetical protein